MATMIETLPRSPLTRLRALLFALASLGLPQWFFYLAQRLWRGGGKSGRSYTLISKRSRFSLQCRAGTSDLQVFSQIFIKREYRCLDDVQDARLIIDCGANVGYSSAYFLSRYPRSSVICVEPDPANFSVLESNLHPYMGRFKAICSAIWSHSTGLLLSEEPYLDGREWARTVRESRPGEIPTMLATDLRSLIRDSGHARVSILKIDVEGAEEKIFAADCDDWLSQVDNLVIELHGPNCAEVFYKAIAKQKFHITQCDELTVCKRASVLSSGLVCGDGSKFDQVRAEVP